MDFQEGIYVWLVHISLKMSDLICRDFLQLVFSKSVQFEILSCGCFPNLSTFLDVWVSPPSFNTLYVSLSSCSAYIVYFCCLVQKHFLRMSGVNVCPPLSLGVFPCVADLPLPNYSAYPS